MDKLKMWLIPGIVVIIIIGGLIFLRGRIPEATPPGGLQEEETGPKGFAPPEEPGPRQKIENDATAMSDALHSGDITDCEKITWNEELKQECLDNLNYAAGLRSDDESQCEQIENESLRQKCRNKVYLNVAVDTRDLSVCDMISDELLKQLCRDQVQVLLGRNAESLSECDNIESTVLKAKCQDNFLIKNSIAEKNMEGCNSIRDEEIRTQCTRSVEKTIEIAAANQAAVAASKEAETPQEKLAMCDNLPAGRATRCKDSVYPQLAVEEKNPSHCDKISDSDEAVKCKTDLAQNLDQYYLREAIATGDPSLCNRISSQSVQTTCKSSI
jgi:hypothetical protein